MTFTVIAHRGHQGRCPECTTEAFDAALDAGFQHVEMDTQLTADGVAIILHDEIMGRTVQGSGHVADHAWSELCDLDAGTWYTREPASWSVGQPGEPGTVTVRTSPDFSHCRIPTLEKVLRRYLGRAHIHLELKSKQQQLPAAVASMLRQCSWVDASGSLTAQAASTTAQPSTSDAVAALPYTDITAFQAPGLTVTSFHLCQLQSSKQLLPGVRHAWLVHDITDEILKTARDAHLSQLCPRADLLTPEAVAKAEQAGFSVRAWGLKDKERLLMAVRCGAHGGTLDDPSAALEMLQS